jgi:hypothetical protein
MVFSISGILIRLPIVYHLVGRSGPISTRDLWSGFFRHLPLWVFVFATASIARLFLATKSSITQLTIGGLIGTVAGVLFICVMSRQRRVALDLIRNISELRRTKRK